MIRVALYVVVVLVVLLLIRMALDTGRGATASIRRRMRGGAAGSREWDRRTDQVKRQLKGVPAPEEPREDMVAWVMAHAGVEAYVEPKTVMSPLSVVFVDAAGEWKRFPLAEDRFLRALAKDRGINVFDASRTGYPPRMRRGHGGGEPPPG